MPKPQTKPEPMMNYVLLNISIFRSQEKELEELAKRLGRSKADLMREALTVLISTYSKE